MGEKIMKLTRWAGQSGSRCSAAMPDPRPQYYTQPILNHPYLLKTYGVQKLTCTQQLK